MKMKYKRTIESSKDDLAKQILEWIKAEASSPINISGTMQDGWLEEDAPQVDTYEEIADTVKWLPKEEEDDEE